MRMLCSLPRPIGSKVHTRLLGAMHEVCHSSLVFCVSPSWLASCDAAVAVATPPVSKHCVYSPYDGMMLVHVI